MINLSASNASSGASSAVDAPLSTSRRRALPTEAIATAMAKSQDEPRGNMSLEVVQRLSRRRDVDLTSYCQVVLKHLANDPDSPVPPEMVELIQEDLAAFVESQSEVGLYTKLLAEAHAQKKQRRDQPEVTMRNLGLLVQALSRGNVAKVFAVGMGVKDKGSRTKQLPFPEALAVDVSQTPGKLKVSWEAVRKAKGYILRYASAEAPDSWIYVHQGRATLLVEDLKPGMVYHFQVAAAGGSTGQSFWSPVVSRMAA